MSIKEIIKSLAINSGIEVSGFSQNAFVALFPYYVEKEKGNISIYARGEDYHRVVKKRLKPIEDELIKYGAKTLIHCDNGIYNDRMAAYNAGLGFFGKNGLLINDRYGSFFFIGQVIHDLEIAPDAPLNKTCYQCGKCIDACITGTLKDGFKKEDCLSFITQKKGELTVKEREYIKKGNMCYGCDVCQEVCPYNENVKTTDIEEFLKDRKLSFNIDELMISEREFLRRYKNYAFSWRGGKIIKRNLDILREKYEEK